MAVAELHRDLLVAGGGLAGLMQGVLLESSGWRVAVLERSDGRKALADPRSLALSESTRRILQALGVWDAVASECAPIDRIDVSQRGSFGTTCLRAEDEQLQALGYVVPAGALAKILRERFEAAPHGDLLTEATVEHVRVDGSGLDATLQHGGTPLRAHARLLIAADGPRSALRGELGLETEEVDYGQSALIAKVRMGRAPDGRAYERFTADGPLALLPHPSGAWALVWAMPRESARRAQLWPEARFLEALQEALGGRAGQALEVLGPRHCYRLSFCRTRRRIAPRCVLIGDAAFSLHPVAAQGFNLVVRDAAWLAQMLRDAEKRGEDPGSEALLHDYLRVRKADAQRVAGFTDFLAQCFTWRNPLARGLRAAALLALESMPGCRTRLVRFGMGADLPLPDLAQPEGEEQAHA